MRSRKRIFALPALSFLLAACGSAGLEPGQTIADVPVEDREIEHILDEVEARLGENKALLAGPELNALVESAFAETIEPDDRSDVATMDAYRANDFAPLLLADGTWNENAEAVLDALRTLDDHAMRQGYPEPAAFIEARSELPKIAERIATATLTATPAQWKTLADSLDEQGFDPKDTDAVDALLEQLRSADPAVNPMPHLAARVAEVQAERDRWRALVASTEAELAVALGDYAAEMRLAWHRNTSRLRLWTKYAKRKTRYRARIMGFFGHVETVGVARALAGITPKHPQYALLIDARARYAEMLAAGSWPKAELYKLPKFQKRIQKKRNFGKEWKGLSTIKSRLEAEGYFTGTIDDVYTEQLVRSIKDYQRTHQLTPDGDIDKRLIRNMNIPVESRLAKIDVTLQRYRESPVGSFDYYVLVNIPDFHAEVWNGGELTMRFGIVVGKNNLQRDPVTNEVVRDRKGKAIFPNRTPMQTAFMERVIYNPYWNIPPRIYNEEYDEKISLDPTWPAQNGFEVVNPDDPRRRYMRQLPGEDNALGRVKFIFPNPHDVYLHDTPQKRLFKRPVRAFSHGCMRVSKPLEFAEHLLKEDGQWNPSKVNRILSEEPLRERTFNLDRQIPVHIDYFNARVDDHGNVHFLSDVYGFDEKRVERRKKEVTAK